eukprot:comp17189_c0_seq1/m.16079 comp17189_c0_seq1/g.16079  ORF comp17189_c0_seq1/g.16079 comp17189_c0_seq1/m.16079 type:complete len:572 (-) comp17189_c0_seq1:75-1790(-)
MQSPATPRENTPCPAGSDLPHSPVTSENDTQQAHTSLQSERSQGENQTAKPPSPHMFCSTKQDNAGVSIPSPPEPTATIPESEQPDKPVSESTSGRNLSVEQAAHVIVHVDVGAWASQLQCQLPGRTGVMHPDYVKCTEALAVANQQEILLARNVPEVNITHADPEPSDPCQGDGEDDDDPVLKSLSPRPRKWKWRYKHAHRKPEPEPEPENQVPHDVMEQDGTRSDQATPTPAASSGRGKGTETFKAPYPVAKGKKTPTTSATPEPATTTTGSPSPLAKKGKKRPFLRSDSIESLGERKSPQPVPTAKKTKMDGKETYSDSDDEPLFLSRRKNTGNSKSPEPPEVVHNLDSLGKPDSDPEIDFPYDGPVYVGEGESSDSELDLEEIKKGRTYPFYMRPFVDSFYHTTTSPYIDAMQFGWERQIRLRSDFNGFESNGGSGAPQADVYFYKVSVGTCKGYDSWTKKRGKGKPLDQLAREEGLTREQFDRRARSYIPGTIVLPTDAKNAPPRNNRGHMSKTTQAKGKRGLMGRGNAHANAGSSSDSGPPGDYFCLDDVILDSDNCLTDSDGDW